MASKIVMILTALEHFQLPLLLLPSPFSAEAINPGCKGPVCLQLCDFLMLKGAVPRYPTPFFLHRHLQPPKETTADKHQQL